MALLEHTFRWRHTHSTQCIRVPARRLSTLRRRSFLPIAQDLVICALFGQLHSTFG